MRKLTPLLICLCLLISAASTMANRMADSLAFQGRLTDASDNPVPDGPRDLTLSLWTDSVGGTMLHSEVVVVTVSKGRGRAHRISGGTSAGADVHADALEC